MNKRSSSTSSIVLPLSLNDRRSTGHKRLSISVKPEHESLAAKGLPLDFVHVKENSLENIINQTKGHYVPRFSVRMVLLGDSNVGKTTMISTLMQDSPGFFYRRTTGADFFRYIIPSLSIDIKMIDMSGHRAFHSKLCPDILSKSPDIVCMVYSNADKTTLDSLTSYWAKRLAENSLNEGCRVVLIANNQPDCIGRQINEALAKAAISKLAKILGKKQIDFFEINAGDQANVMDFFETLAEKAAYRILSQLLKQLRKNAANLIQTKLILRKSGFSEDFASKYRSEPLCTLVKDQTDNNEFEPNEVATDHEDDEMTSESTKWLELHGRQILIFSSVKQARHGAAPIRKILLDDTRCEVQLISDLVLNIRDDITNNLFVLSSKEVAKHWYSVVQEILLDVASSG